MSTTTAKLYYLNNMSYEPIKDEIEFNTSTINLSEEIAVFKRQRNNKLYTVISVNREIDKIIEKHGGIAATETDRFPPALKNKEAYPGELVFGDSELITFL